MSMTINLMENPVLSLSMHQNEQMVARIPIRRSVCMLPENEILKEDKYKRAFCQGKLFVRFILILSTTKSVTLLLQSDEVDIPRRIHLLNSQL